MSKFNTYAQRLDSAFKEARDSYAAAAGRLDAAKKEDQLANNWFQETYVGERERRQARAKAGLLAAKEDFKVEARRIWNEYDAKANAIRTEFLAAVRANGLASPDDVDANALELLKSGVLTPEDMEGFANRFDSNPTMLKLISKYASDAAEKAKTSGKHADYMKLVSVVAATKDGSGQAVREWDKLAEVAMYCSGRARRGDMTVTDPDSVVSMGTKWEEITAESIGKF